MKWLLRRKVMNDVVGEDNSGPWLWLTFALIGLWYWRLIHG